VERSADSREGTPVLSSNVDENAMGGIQCFS
jgi:hypothetical protein